MDNAIAKSALHRIRAIAERWFLADPLLFGIWSTHRLTAEPKIRTMRVRRGAVEFNPRFIATLSDDELVQVVRFEALRILLKHPYQRRKENPSLSYLASNVTIQEYWRSSLPFLNAFALFGSHEFDRQYFEFYYQKLADNAVTLTSDGLALDSDGDEAGVGDYANADVVGVENSAEWDADELLTEQIDQQIRDAVAANNWGTIAGDLRERVQATLTARLDFRHVLRQFRSSVISSQRRLTRMRPSRRYGFTYMGSRHDFATRLLVAVDVSGSMKREEIGQGFAVINRFFKYGIESIDVVQFDTELKSEPTTLRRTQHEIEIVGRGGTKFTPIIDYIDAHPNYDGVIVFTDGIAPAPPPPSNRRTCLLWLFNNEKAHRQMSQQLEQIGLTAFLRSSETS